VGSHGDIYIRSVFHFAFRPTSLISVSRDHITLACLQFAFQKLFFKLVSNQRFDAGIMIIILLNMFAMAIEHNGMSDDLKKTLEYVNQWFLDGLWMVSTSGSWLYSLWNVFSSCSRSAGITSVNRGTVSTLSSSSFPFSVRLFSLLPFNYTFHRYLCVDAVS